MNSLILWISAAIVLLSLATLIYRAVKSKTESDEDYLKQYFKELEFDTSKEVYEVPAFTDNESRNSKVETITLDRTSIKSNSLFSSYYPSQTTVQNDNSHDKVSQNGPELRDSQLSFMPK